MKSKIVFILFFAVTLFAQSNLNNKFRLGNSYEQSGKLEKAMTLYEEVAAAQPQNSQYTNALNEVYLKLKKYDKSISFLKKRIKQKPYDVQLYGMLGATYFIAGNNDSAKVFWDKGISINNNALFNYTIISNFAIQNRAFEYAIKILNEAKKKSKNPVQFSYQLAQIYSYTMDYKKAAEEYCEVLLKQPSQLNYIKRRIEIYLAAVGALEQTIETAQQYKENSAIKELLVFLYIRNNNFNDAFELIKILEKEKGNSGTVVYNFATEVFNRKEFDISSKAFKYIIDHFPKSRFIPNSKIGFAKSLEAKLDVEWNKQQANWKPYFIIDTTGANRYNPIIETYRSIIKSANGELQNEALFRIGKIYESRFLDFKNAEINFNRIIKNSSLSIYYQKALFELGRIDLINNNLDEAKTKLTKVAGSKKSGSELKGKALLLLSKIELYKGSIVKCLSLLNELSRDLSSDFANDAISISLAINMGKRDSVSLAEFGKGEILAYQSNFKKAGEIFKKLSENKRLLFVNNISRLKYAEMLIAENNYPVAIEILKQLSETKEMNIFADKSFYLLAQVFEFGVADKKSAISTYEKFLEIFPNSLYLEKSQKNLKRLKITK